MTLFSFSGKMKGIISRPIVNPNYHFALLYIHQSIPNSFDEVQSLGYYLDKHRLTDWIDEVAMVHEISLP